MMEMRVPGEENGGNGESALRPVRAVVLLSGGLDSATVLALARAAGRECYALSVSYGQRHQAELHAAARVAHALGAREHRIMHVDLARLGGSALTDRNIDIPTAPTAGIPVTYVPARNTIMLSLALAWAEVARAGEIHIGVNAVDYSGYPDCRPEYVAAFEKLAALATKAGVEGAALSICAPLVNMSKAQIIREGTRLGVDYAMTVSCYQADSHGRACGLCDSCRLRREGFAAAGVPDPTNYSGAQIV
jgi:7-cyano-7-deazaguanine synthase